MKLNRHGSQCVPTWVSSAGCQDEEVGKSTLHLKCKILNTGGVKSASLKKSGNAALYVRSGLGAIATTGGLNTAVVGDNTLGQNVKKMSLILVQLYIMYRQQVLKRHCCSTPVRNISMQWSVWL